MSFDAADHMAFRTHLIEDHKITRNIDKIIELSRHIIKPGINNSIADTILYIAW